MKPNKKHLTLRIALLKEAIRRKYNSFKSGALESERLLERKYKPIISELKKTKNEPTLSVKKEEEVEEEEQEEEEAVKEEYTSPPASPTLGETAQLDTLLSTPRGRETVSRYIDDHFEHLLTKKYMDLFMRDRGGKNASVDHIYGPRYEGETLMIGNSKLEFDDNGAIVINNIRYNATEGLYELLFKRMPDEDKYDDDDLTAYKNILLKSNAHKKGYKYTGNINRNVSIKYKRIIEDLFPITKKGSGMQWKSSHSRDIVHWDDPNELVERLRLLAMSAETGNTSHTNEIINIVEELREAGYIKGSGNRRFQSLLK